MANGLHKKPAHPVPLAAAFGLWKVPGQRPENQKGKPCRQFAGAARGAGGLGRWCWFFLALLWHAAIISRHGKCHFAIPPITEFPGGCAIQAEMSDPRKPAKPHATATGPRGAPGGPRFEEEARRTEEATTRQQRTTPTCPGGWLEDRAAQGHQGGAAVVVDVTTSRLAQCGSAISNRLPRCPGGL